MSLRVCPECDYDLAGLPEAHRCPECGAAYDELTRVWKPRRPWVLLLSVALSAGYALIAVGGNALTVLHNPFKQVSRSGRYVAVVVVCGLVIGLSCWILRLWIHRVRFLIATTPDGILVRLSVTKTLIPWSEVARVRRGELYSGKTLRHAVHVDRVRGQTVSVMHVLRSDEEVAEVIAICEEARRRALAGGATSTGAHETLASFSTELLR